MTGDFPLKIAAFQTLKAAIIGNQVHALSVACLSVSGCVRSIQTSNCRRRSPGEFVLNLSTSRLVCEQRLIGTAAGAFPVFRRSKFELFWGAPGFWMVVSLAC